MKKKYQELLAVLIILFIYLGAEDNSCSFIMENDTLILGSD